MLHADEIRIDNDEGRITLVVEHDEGTTTYDIHSVALGFYDEVRRELGPYVYEAEQARAEVHAGIPQMVTTRPVSVEEAIEAGYALDDPKSPGYHDRAANHWDRREGR